ncbi:MAG: hypothetical protein GWO85_01485, partial [Simkaniaceae bacterium]|nr:hypothetical protein [Simkaniaceae bacterium]
MGANWDSIGIHTYNLTGHELHNIGQHELRPELTTQLVNGALYRLKFQGETSRNYPATVMTFEPVIYDIVRPVITGYTQGVTNDLTIDIIASEPLKSIDVEIRQDDYQLGYPIIYSFPDSILPLKSGQFRLPVMDELIEQRPYRIFITGKDRAANYGATVDIGVFIYDKTPPEIVILNPDNHDYINLPEVSYSLTEPLSQASIVVTSTSDEGVRTIKLDGEYLAADEHDLSLEHSYKFRDSTYYSFSLFGSDFAENNSDTVSIDSVYYDITPPELTVIFPYDSAVINEPSMSYISNEQLSTAIMEWIHVVGTEDTIAPYYVELSGNELVSGEKIRKSLPDTTGLRDGAIYTIYLSAWDLAGNAIDRIQIDNILFDASPPELSITLPQSNTITNSLALSYSSTEYLSNGTLLIERMDGDTDPGAPYIIELTGSELSDGYHDNVLLAGIPPLNSGTTYFFTLTGTDLGTNKADPVSVTHVTYDNIAPNFHVTFPAPNSINTRKAFEYTLSEDLAKGHCILLQSGGKEDSLSPHIIPLFTDNLLAGEHKLNIDNLAINEASRYTLQVVGLDYAGNSTDTIPIPDIIYDVTPPEMIISLPQSNSINIVQEITYTLSENLESAYAVWTRTGGEKDPNSPHRVLLTEEESLAGSHSYNTLANQSALISGTAYNLTFEGQDGAGHSLVVHPIMNITYDFVAPVVSLIRPASNTFSYSTIIEYDLSETLVQGWIILNKVSDEPVQDSPGRIALSPEYNIAGHHQFSLLDLDKTALVSNTTYALWMTGRDAAGNDLKSDSVKQFTYDNTAPVLAIENPAENGFINTVLLTFRNSEDLASAKMVWQNEVTGESQTILLSGNELPAGLKQDQLLQQTPNLIDGQTYSLTYSGTDIAG